MASLSKDHHFGLTQICIQMTSLRTVMQNIQLILKTTADIRTMSSANNIIKVAMSFGEN